MGTLSFDEWQTLDHPITLIKAVFPLEDWPSLDQETLNEKNGHQLNILKPHGGLPPILDILKKTPKTPYPWDPFPDADPRRATLYTRLRHRLWRIQALLDKEQTRPVKNDQWKCICHALRQFQDMHIPQVLYFERKGPLDKNVDPMMLSMLPDSRYAMHPGNLVDMLAYTWYIDIWRNQKKPKVPEYYEALMWLISKALPYRCAGRSLNKTTFKFAGTYPQITEILRRMLLCSLVGGYTWCTKWPSFETRLRSYYYLHERFDSIRFLKWINNGNTFTQDLIRFSMKEYVILATRMHPGMAQALPKHMSVWSDMIMQTFAIGDYLRNILDYGPESNWMPSFSKYNKEMDRSHESTDIKTRSLRRFIEAAFLACATSRNKLAVDPAYRETHFTNKEWAVMKGMIERCKRDEIPYFILSDFEDGHNPFALPRNVLEEIYKMEEFYYETRKISEAFQTTLEVMDPRTFQLIMSFFEILDMLHAIELVPLSMNMYRAQVKALLRMYNKKTFSELHPAAGGFYVSHHCGICAHIVPDPNKLGAPSNILARGSRRVLYREDGSRVAHAKRRMRPRGKKRETETQDKMKQMQERAKNESKAEMRARAIAICKGHPLPFVNLTGFLLRERNRGIVLCCQCACPTEFTFNKYMGDVVVCGRCDSRTNMILQHAQCFICAELQSDTVTLFDVTVYDDVASKPCVRDIKLCEKHSKVDTRPKKERTGDCYMNLSDVMKKYKQAVRFALKCIICKNTRRDGYTKNYRVLNDLVEDRFHFEQVALCGHHAHRLQKDPEKRISNLIPDDD